MEQQDHPVSSGAIAKIPIELFPRFRDNPAKSALEYMSLTRGSTRPFVRNLRKVTEAIVRGSQKRFNAIDPETYLFDGDFRAPDDKPRFLHVDLAATQDAVGFGMCHAGGFVESIVQFPGERESRKARVPYIVFDILVRLKKKEGELEIKFSDIRNMIVELETKRGFNISGGLITFDGWQSIDSIQLLRDLGFICYVLSIDHTTSVIRTKLDKPPLFIERQPLQNQPSAANMVLREAMYQDRIEFPGGLQMHNQYETWFEKEAREQEWLSDKLKVVKMQGGSDDLWQAAAGAAFNCFNNAKDLLEFNDFTRADRAIEDRFYQSVGRADRDTDVIVDEGDERRLDYEDSFYQDVYMQRLGDLEL